MQIANHQRSSLLKRITVFGAELTSRQSQIGIVVAANDDGQPVKAHVKCIRQRMSER